MPGGKVTKPLRVAAPGGLSTEVAGVVTTTGAAYVGAWVGMTVGAPVGALVGSCKQVHEIAHRAIDSI